MSLVTLLPGHTSPETAYVVADYPYGFRLRCTIRYWLEYKRSRGYRLMSQTTNPKKSGEVWNKPKASTYFVFGVMGLNAEGHVTWDVLSEYDIQLDKMRAFKEAYYDAIDDTQQRNIDLYIALAIKYEARKTALAAEGKELFTITTSEAIRVA